MKVPTKSDCLCDFADETLFRADRDSWSGWISIKFPKTWSKCQSRDRGWSVVKDGFDTAKLHSERVECFGKSVTRKSLIAEPDASDGYPPDSTRWLFALSLLTLQVLSVLPSQEDRKQKQYNRKNLWPIKSFVHCRNWDRLISSIYTLHPYVWEFWYFSWMFKFCNILKRDWILNR